MSYKLIKFKVRDEVRTVTPQSIRLRKRWLKEHERRRADRETNVAL